MSEIASPLTRAVCDHVRAHWPNTGVEVTTWKGGGVVENLAALELVRAAPAEDGQPWLQVTAGAASLVMDDGYGIELFLLTREPDAAALKLLAMVAHLHGDERYPLSLGQVLEIGVPWLPGASCDHLLVVLPDLFGPEFEWHSDAERTVRFIWLMPITAAEAAHARQHGFAELLRELGRARADVTDPERASVV